MKTSVIKEQQMNSLRKTTVALFIASIILSGITPLSALAQGDLMIMPKRVVLDASKKQQEIDLANSGHDTATYLISIVNMRMSDSGKTEFVAQPDSAQNFADGYLRIYPRRVTLWPGKTQVIKLQATKYSLLPVGEYRSHIYFRPVPNDKPMGEEDKSKKDATSISVSIKPVIGFTIPVIIRVGVSDVLVSLSDISVTKNGDNHQLNITFNRQGNISAYGALTVIYISPDGTETKVGFAKGISVYATNARRSFQLKLKEDKSINYNEGSLHVAFKNIDIGKSETLAEADLALRK